MRHGVIKVQPTRVLFRPRTGEVPPGPRTNRLRKRLTPSGQRNYLLNNSRAYPRSCVQNESSGSLGRRLAGWWDYVETRHVVGTVLLFSGMKKQPRLLAIVLVFAAVFVPASAFAATPHAATVVAFTEVTDAPDEVIMNDSGIIPAVEQIAPTEEVVEQPWTFRFMVPVIAVLGIAVLAAVTLHYALRVRGRYRVEG